MTLKVCCISDTHMSHEELNMPEADILVHAGDFSGRTRIQELAELNRWFGTVKEKYSEIFVVPGNHDGQFEGEGLAPAKYMLSNAKVLVDEAAEFRGYKIYGSPWTIEFYDWFFMKKPKEIKEVWKKIPDDVNILITHQPPHEILDTVKRGPFTEHVGCPDLRNEIFTRLKDLKLHVFGHLHDSGGQHVTVDGKVFCNAAVLDDYYNLRTKRKNCVVIEV